MMEMWKSIVVISAVLCCASLAHGFSYSKANIFPRSCIGAFQNQHSMHLRVPGPRDAFRMEKNRPALMMALADIASAPTASSATAASSAVAAPSSAAVAVPAGVAAGAAESAANTGTVAAGDIFTQVMNPLECKTLGWVIHYPNLGFAKLIRHGLAQIVGGDAPGLTLLASISLLLAIAVTGAVGYLTYENWRVGLIDILQSA